VFFGPRGPKSGFREKDDERVTNLGVGWRGVFYCGKIGVENRGCIFYCEEIGGDFFDENLVKSQNLENRVGVDSGIGVGNLGSDGNLGWGKMGWENVPEGTKR